MDLDDLLDRSAPPIAARNPGLGRALGELASQAEGAVARPRHRVALVGVSVAAMLGVGAVASAAGVLPGWPVFDTSSGNNCSIEVRAEAPGPGDVPGVPASMSDREAKATVAEAQAFLKDFDFDGVDRAEAVAWWRTQEKQARENQPDPAEQAPLSVLSIVEDVNSEKAALVRCGLSGPCERASATYRFDSDELTAGRSVPWIPAQR